MVLLNNVVSGRKPLKEQKNKGNEERYIYIYIYFVEEIAACEGKGEGRGVGEEGGEGRGKRPAPFLALGSGFQLVQAVNAAISRLGKHPVSSSKF